MYIHVHVHICVSLIFSLLSLSQVVRERIRVLEFLRDYDKLKSGRILTTLFYRALDLCGFQLTPSEVNVLVNEYRSVKDSSCVDYVLFSDDIESVFTVKELEKMPTVEVHMYTYNVQCTGTCTLYNVFLF